MLEGARAGTNGDRGSGARQATSNGCEEVVIDTAPGVLATVQRPLSLLSSHTAVSQSGVSTRTNCVVLTPGLAQPPGSKMLTAAPAIEINRQIRR
jgi:hypothetical protein